EQQALANLGLPVRPSDYRDLSDDEVARRLRTLGLPPGLTGDDLPANLLPFRAPFAGVVLKRDITVGELASTTQPQFVLADTSRLWLLLDVRQEDAPRVRAKQLVQFTADPTGQEASGRIAWTSPEVDPKTRTVRARVEVENPNGELRPATFGKATIE